MQGTDDAPSAENDAAVGGGELPVAGDGAVGGGELPVAENDAAVGGGELPVAGLGVDIIEIDRMERVLARTPRMKERVFTKAERDYAQKRARPAVHYALFFAAREAVLKALGIGFSGVAFDDVEVGHDRFGRPVPLLHGRAQELAQAQGVVEMQLSLSYTHMVGVASAVAIKEQDRPRKDEKLDSRLELERQFKAMRAMLDDMDERIKALDEGEAGDAAPEGVALASAVLADAAPADGAGDDD